MNEERTIHTGETRVAMPDRIDRQICSCARLFCRVKHSLLAAFSAGKVIRSVKSEYLKRFGITARYFNAACVELEGSIASAKELQKMRVSSLRQAIEQVEDRIKRLQSKNSPIARQQLYGKRHRLCKLETKLSRFTSDLEKGRVRICFGGKKRFRAQYQDDQDRETWEQEWDRARNYEFFTLGSKDETGGNQTCTPTLAPDGSISLRLRLPDALATDGKYLEFHNLWFPYGHDILVAAIQECQIRRDLKGKGDPRYKERGQAISFRFKRDQKGWRIFFSTLRPPFQGISDDRLGAIGVDVNSDHLAVTEIDHQGNPVDTVTISLCLYGKTKQQSQAIIGDACAQLVEYAVRKKKPLVIERLDFTRKKATLRQLSRKRARCLSSFAYRAILSAICSRGYRCGIRVHSVNPAFTSLIGRIKYARRYGLTTHQAAALCIARRHKNYSEPLSSMSSVPDGKGGHVSLSVPARNQKEKEWAYLKRVAKKLKEALAEHFRAIRDRSTGPPNDPCDGQPLESCG